MRYRLRVFLLGLRECRSDYTTNPGEDFIEVYDAGRALGRRVFGLE